MTEKFAFLLCSGSSINDHKDSILKILELSENDENFITVGINNFPIKFAEIYKKDVPSIKTNYWIFSDECMAYTIREHYNGQKMIINANLNSEVLAPFQKPPVKLECLFRNSEEITLEDDNNLYGKYSTPLKAIHWLLKRGYSVIIIGMDNRCNSDGKWNYFYDVEQLYEKTIDQIIDIKIQIDEFSKYGKIYKIDNSNINVPELNLNVLLDERIKNMGRRQEEKKENVEQITEEIVAVEETNEATETVNEEATEEVKEETKKGKKTNNEQNEDLISLKVPHFLPQDDATIHVDNQEYEINNGKVLVKYHHVSKLKEQGFE